MKIGILSDTHGWLNPSLLKYFSETDEIWHAGDIGSLELADKLESFRKLRAVHGNIDDAKTRIVYPEFQVFMAEGKKVLLTHIAGTPGRYNSRVIRLIQEEAPDILVCGHSHIARVEFDRKMNLLYVNPGAAGKHGFHTIMTALRFSVSGTDIHDLEVIEMGERGRIV